ncbi:hypothetical protein BDZ89DRAFT_451057 [Hymenopellis radicata]|nr:hypothetical protein BDZ89DRAFT_451057 [Hymenopellis radicata]
MRDAHIALVSPVQDIPPEILSAIFSFTLDAHFDAFDKTGLTCPWLLGRICRQWRDVAWTTPALWSSFQMSKPPALTSTGMSRCVDRVKDVLARSGEAPLSTSFIFIPECLEPFAGIASRLCDLHIVYSHGKDLRSLQGFDFSGLRRLSIHTGGMGTSDEVYVDISRTAPQLQEAELVLDGSIPPSPNAIILPWSQLTRLKLWAYDGTTLRNIRLHGFPQCTRLVTLDVTSILHDDPLMGSAISLPDLQSIKITFLSQLEPLRCVSLHTLEACLDYFEFDSIQHQAEDFFRAFLLRSQCTIYRLKLMIRERRWRSVHTVSWNIFSACLPHVTELELKSQRLRRHSNELFAHLEYGPAQRHFPRLESLTLETRDEWPPNAEAVLIRAIESRRHGVSGDEASCAKLRRIHIRYVWRHHVIKHTKKVLDLGDVSLKWNIRLLDCLTEMEKDGLNVEIERIHDPSPLEVAAKGTPID